MSRIFWAKIKDGSPYASIAATFPLGIAVFPDRRDDAYLVNPAPLGDQQIAQLAQFAYSYLREASTSSEAWEIVQSGQLRILECWVESVEAEAEELSADPMFSLELSLRAALATVVAIQYASRQPEFQNSDSVLKEIRAVGHQLQSLLPPGSVLWDSIEKGCHPEFDFND